MTMTKFARTVLCVVAVASAGACTDGLTDINSNPNAPTDVGVAFLLPQAIQAGVRQVFGAGEMLRHTSIWSQQFVQIQYADEERGMVRPGTMEGFWTIYYAGPLMDIQRVVDKAVASGDPNIEGVGRVWRSWLFHHVTDLWGDIPYSEALASESNTTPAYDSQSDVYSGLLADLTLGASLITTSGADFATGDLLYDNDFERWRRFANSLRMRLAMRLSNSDPAMARTEFIAAFNAGGFQSNDDNAMLEYPGFPWENPLAQDFLGRDDNGISRTMVNELAALNDPRLELYAEPAASDGAYRGRENGAGILSFTSFSSFSRIGNFWRRDGAATPSAVMTYAEVLFLEAEAAARGWITADPAALYVQGIQASMDLYDDYGVGPSDAEVATYLAQGSVDYLGGAAGLVQINHQKWIALWMNGAEAWANWRRTDVPTLLVGPDVRISRIPVRFSYPDSEQSLNSANMNAAITRQGGGLELTTPVWWDGT